jgi:archaeosine-15-forming tRNA-guanine transglycosylase
MAMAATLGTASGAEACRIEPRPTITYDRWVEEADQVVLGRVVSIGQVREPTHDGRTWARPVMQVDRMRVLRGVSSERISVRGEDVMSQCEPTITSEIRGLRVGDEVLVMLDDEQIAFGLMKATTDEARRYVNRLTLPAE